MGFWGGRPPRESAILSASYQGCTQPHDLPLDVDLDHLVETAFSGFSAVKLFFRFPLSILSSGRSRHVSPHSRSGDQAPLAWTQVASIHMDYLEWFCMRELSLLPMISFPPVNFPCRIFCTLEMFHYKTVETKLNDPKNGRGRRTCVLQTLLNPG